MKIYDISQQVFGCAVYPGDESPVRRQVCNMDNGDGYNLTCFSMCAHNGTHIDAPFHFVKEGITVEKIPLEKTVGKCFVTEYNGEITAAVAEEIIQKAENYGDAKERVLLKGNAVVTAEAAEKFADGGILLIGVESQSVGEVNAPAQVHKILLNREIVLLEGIRLSDVSEGEYFLNAAPICLEYSDGAPCRAILIAL